MTPRLLEGIRIIESANVITGPFAGMMLAHLGAEVIKVEPPNGDSFRNWDPKKKSVTPTFDVYNRGKRSIALDLKKSEGREVFKQLAKSADVVIENSRPGAMERLGLGWEVLREINPGLVYCFITGLGSWGPESNQPTFDAVAQALSGLWSQFTDLNSPEPVGPPMADQLTGLYAAFAILAGVESSRRTGIGTKLEVSMLASCIAFQGSNLATFLSDGVVSSRRTRAEMSQSYALIASDGLPFAIHLSSPQKFWEGLCRSIGQPELIDDQRFVGKSDRIKNYDELLGILQQAATTDSRASWLERLRANDVPCAPILDVSEAIDHPQVRALGIIGYPSQGKPWVKAPIASDGEYLGAGIPAPLLSADADQILADIGLSEEEIAELRAKSVVC